MYQGMKSKFAGFGSSSESFIYREIQNSNWRHREDEERRKNVQRPHEELIQHPEIGEDIARMMCEEFDGIPSNEISSRSARCMSVIIGFKSEEELQSNSASTKSSNDKLTLESCLNISSIKKRPRPMNVGDVLNDDENTTKIQKK
ncbi:hypothetical protein K3495_g9954 [Podosphaera aphanis]|nr:hypothetical protein K3495_g9954 [Podosphaera aphanis]